MGKVRDNLSHLDYRTIYLSGRDNYLADMLSRVYEEESINMGQENYLEDKIIQHDIQSSNNTQDTNTTNIDTSNLEHLSANINLDMSNILSFKTATVATLSIRLNLAQDCNQQ